MVEVLLAAGCQEMRMQQPQVHLYCRWLCRGLVLRPRNWDELTVAPFVSAADDGDDMADEGQNPRLRERSSKKDGATLLLPHVTAPNSLVSGNRNKRKRQPEVQFQGRGPVGDDVDETTEDTELASEDDDDPPPPPIARRQTKPRPQIKVSHTILPERDGHKSCFQSKFRTFPLLARQASLRTSWYCSMWTTRWRLIYLPFPGRPVQVNFEFKLVGQGSRRTSMSALLSSEQLGRVSVFAL